MRVVHVCLRNCFTLVYDGFVMRHSVFFFAIASKKWCLFSRGWKAKISQYFTWKTCNFTCLKIKTLFLSKISGGGENLISWGGGVPPPCPTEKNPASIIRGWRHNVTSNRSASVVTATYDVRRRRRRTVPFTASTAVYAISSTVGVCLKKRV